MKFRLRIGLLWIFLQIFACEKEKVIFLITTSEVQVGIY